MYGVIITAYVVIVCMELTTLGRRYSHMALGRMGTSAARVKRDQLGVASFDVNVKPVVGRAAQVWIAVLGHVLHFNGDLTWVCTQEALVCSGQMANWFCPAA